MLQDRQVERMVQKVARLEQMYGEFLIKNIVEPRVTTVVNGKEFQVEKGYRWGSDFKCQTFSFIVENIDENEKHYVFANSGAAEHLVSVNGKKVGMLDYITDAFEPPARTHRYLLLEGLKNGDLVTLEAYYSHPISGLNPYDEPFTWAYDSLIEDRPYQQIALAVLDQEIKEFCEKLTLLNKLYNSEKDRFQLAEIEKIYL